jgi:CPA2 family monovalent cation:H+ antiporter-2
MPHDIELIVTLAGCLAAALVCGYATLRLGISPLVGYLVAGILVGPYTPGFVANIELAQQLSEVGVILLMFGVGLHFHLRDLLAVRRVAVPGAAVQCTVAGLLGLGLGLAQGWGLGGSALFGIALSVASTVVVTRVLSDGGQLDSQPGRIAVGWLVLEDILTVLVLVLLPDVLGEGRTGLLQIAATVAMALVKVGALMALVLGVGDRIVPWLLERVARTRSRELFTLTVLAVALGIAVGSARVFDVSMALGAFLAGMVVGRSEFSLRAATEALPMRDAFAVLFFVSVGMLFDPGALLRSPALIAASVLIVIGAKPLASLLVMRWRGYPARASMTVAVVLAQIGEFSFILGSAGRELGLLDPVATSTLIATAILSITLTPIAFRAVDWLARWVEPLGFGPGDAPSGSTGDAGSDSGRSRAIIVGHGPVGRTLRRLLRDNGVEPAVVELNLDTARDLAGRGVAAVYGDAAHVETLEQAGIDHATFLLLSSADSHLAPETIRLARERNPHLVVVARANYLAEQAALRAAGADAVFASEGEIALAMTEFVLRRLGADDARIAQARSEIRAELIDTSVDTRSPAAPLE